MDINYADWTGSSTTGSYGTFNWNQMWVRPEPPRMPEGVLRLELSRRGARAYPRHVLTRVVEMTNAFALSKGLKHARTRADSLVWEWSKEPFE